jgi:hypothetical protein
MPAGLGKLSRDAARDAVKDAAYGEGPSLRRARNGDRPQTARTVRPGRERFGPGCMPEERAMPNSPAAIVLMSPLGGRAKRWSCGLRSSLQVMDAGAGEKSPLA